MFTTVYLPVHCKNLIPTKFSAAQEKFSKKNRLKRRYEQLLESFDQKLMVILCKLPTQRRLRKHLPSGRQKKLSQVNEFH